MTYNKPLVGKFYLQKNLVTLVGCYFLFSFAALAQECNKDSSYVYGAYISDLQAGLDTIHSFNLSYLAKELVANGVRKNDLSSRLSKYTLTIGELNAKVKIDGVYTPKGNNCNFLDIR